MAKLDTVYLKSLMGSRGMNAPALAREMGVSRFTAATWLRTGKCETETLTKLAKFFGVSEAALSFGDAGVDATQLANLLGRVMAVAKQNSVTLTDHQIASITSLLYTERRPVTDTIIAQYLSVAKSAG